MKIRQVISAKDVSDILRIPISTVYFYAQQGVIPSIKFGRQRRFDKTEIFLWLEHKKERGDK